jgi:hypothetical protein
LPGDGKAERNAHWISIFTALKQYRQIPIATFDKKVRNAFHYLPSFRLAGKYPLISFDEEVRIAFTTYRPPYRQTHINAIIWKYLPAPSDPL